jgi:hypothetical protein
MRAVLALAVPLVAAAAVTLAGPWLPGYANARTVLRDQVVPPLDPSSYPSPLVGFRKYTKDANLLWDQTLFTVTGLPAGTMVRIATLDNYDGAVWGTTDADGFARSAAAVKAQPSGQVTTVTVRIGAAYAASTDLSPWLPGAGAVASVQFAGPRGSALRDSLYYDQDLSAGIVPVRLAAGDSYTLRTVLGQVALPDDAQPYGAPALADAGPAVLAGKVASWTRGATTLSAKLDAIALQLRTAGTYTDGGPGYRQYLPGHSTGRLTAFLQSDAPAGDDEQYAATYALAANFLGIPARVVFGAQPDDAGVVRGSAVHAWVEVHLVDGTWAQIPQTAFMPDPSKHPDVQPPQQTTDAPSAVVPPPSTIHPAKTPTDTSRVDPVVPPGTPTSWWARFWKTARPYLTWGGPPLLLVVLMVSTILSAKVRRRRRRRTSPIAANRFDGAWRELVDAMRDLSSAVPALRAGLRELRPGQTRREQASLLDRYSSQWAGHGEKAVVQPWFFGAIARQADVVIYGEGDPNSAQAEAFWEQALSPVRKLTRSLPRWRRFQVRLSLRSLVASDRRLVGTVRTAFGGTRTRLARAWGGPGSHRGSGGALPQTGGTA